jgi:serine/threonine-protein kinase
VTPEREEEDPFLLAAAVGLTPATERPASVVRPRVETPDDMTELGVPAGTPAAAAQGVDPAPAVPGRRRRKWPYVVALCVLVATLVAAGVAWAVQAKLFTPSSPVPVLVGRTLPAAEATARTAHLDLRVSGRATSIAVPAGSVVSQQPSAATGGARTTLKQGSAIGVVLSTGPPQVAIPDLASFSDCHDAVQALAGVHLVGVCPPTAAQYDSTVPAGAIVGTSPVGHAPYGSTVTIVTSKGHAPVAVPTVTGTGSSYTSAAAALTAAGFVPQESKVYSSTVPVDQVIGTSPAAGGSQPFASTVAVQVSLGPQPVTVPSLTGQSPSAATTALSALGLVPGGPYGPPGGTTVVSTSPSAGTSVPVGSTVDVYTR